jgi:hypothetical protein
VTALPSRTTAMVRSSRSRRSPHGRNRSDRRCEHQRHVVALKDSLRRTASVQSRGVRKRCQSARPKVGRVLDEVAARGYTLRHPRPRAHLPVTVGPGDPRQRGNVGRHRRRSLSREKRGCSELSRVNAWWEMRTISSRYSRHWVFDVLIDRALVYKRLRENAAPQDCHDISGG